MQVKTSRFGTIEVAPENVITFVHGMYGFEQYTRYFMVNYKPGETIWWMQSVEEPELAFVVADPAQLCADYEFTLPDVEANRLQLTEARQAFIMVVLTVAAGGNKVTANLAAPIVFNPVEMLAMQVILQDNRYRVRHQLMLLSPEKSPQKTTEDKKENLLRVS